MPEDTTIRKFVMDRLKPAVETELHRLEQANADGDLSQVSWRARNLLEVMIWTLHCASSEEASKTFCEDAARDAVDAMKPPANFTLSQEMDDLRKRRQEYI